MNDRPAVYVGTYHKYASGSIDGRWVNPGDYESYEDFIDALNEMHSDEPSGMREFMFQDKEYLPDSLYSESYFSEAAFAYCKAYDEASDSDALEAYVEYFGDDFDDADDLIDKFNDSYFGEFDSDEDLAYELVEETGMLSDVPENLRYYFDYEAYARDLMITDFCEVNGYYFWRF